MKQIRKENQELRNNILTLTNGVSELINEIKKKEETYSRIPVSSRPQYRTYTAPRTVDSQQSSTSPVKPVDEEQNSHVSPVVDQSSNDKKIVEDTKIDETVETAEEEPIEEKKKRWWWPFN